MARPARDPTAAACPSPLKSALSMTAHLCASWLLCAKLPLRPRAVDVSCLRANPYSSQGLRPGASRTAGNAAKSHLPGPGGWTFAIQAPAREHQGLEHCTVRSRMFSLTQICSRMGGPRGGAAVPPPVLVVPTRSTQQVRELQRLVDQHHQWPPTAAARAAGACEVNLRWTAHALLAAHPSS